MKQLINKIVCFYFGNSNGWIRIFGVGFAYKDITIHGLLFSERNNKRKNFILIGKWVVKYLPPDKPQKQTPPRIAEQQYNILKLKQLQKLKTK